MTIRSEHQLQDSVVTSGAKCVTCHGIIPPGRACIHFHFGVAACNDKCARDVPASDRFVDEVNSTEWFWTGNHTREEIVREYAEGDAEEVSRVRGTISAVGPDGQDGPWFAPADNGRFEFWQVEFKLAVLELQRQHRDMLELLRRPPESTYPQDACDCGRTTTKGHESCSDH